MASGRLLSSLLRNRLALFLELGNVYRPAINARKEKLIELTKEKLGAATNSELGQKMRILKEYWKVEMAPPGSQEEWKKLHLDLIVIKEFITKGCWKHLTVKQLWLLTLVSVEVGLWFYLGETVGKMSFVGYKV